MATRFTLLSILIMSASPTCIAASECWALTNMKGQSAASADGYRFAADGYPKPMVLCFDEDSGYVTGDDTKFIKFGSSTLAGWAQKNELELFEVYQIDRANGKVLLSKSRVGTSTAYPGLQGLDLIGAFVGTATKLQEE